ncbi:uncharacterized protein LOC108916769 [Anoplophora glabripennis]|uniref:uncharacterized protein LOC108916769 n=1 Tax=Anoplophora glabripennis TaxID=217634 RepID=UPI0008749078|nr:uncharacterized protein LOC108916769 [Anoplophora glabripennis]
MDNSYGKVRVLLEELIELRKTVPQEISDFYALSSKEILKYINAVKINLRQNDHFNSDNYLLTTPFENLNMKQAYQFDNGQLEKTYEQIQLLQILIKKKNCPISKIIDEI